MTPKYLFILIPLLAAGACAYAPQQALTGADRDAHSCIASAGYVWSQAQEKCLRVWESGIQLTVAKEEESSLAAYAVLSADGTQAELFLPVKTRPPLLQRAFTEQGPYWAAPNSPWLLKRNPEGWRLYKEDALLYTAPNPAGN